MYNNKEFLILEIQIKNTQQSICLYILFRWKIKTEKNEITIWCCINNIRSIFVFLIFVKTFITNLLIYDMIWYANRLQNC